MYVLINRENMSLLHKHPEMDVIANLAWIECQQDSYYIFPIDDASGFREFTDMELKLLYENITGSSDHTRFNRLQLLQIVYDLSVRVKETDANPFEVDRQAEFVKEGMKGRFVYVRGATMPSQQGDLFENACQRVKPSDEEEANALAGKLPALKRAKPAVKPHTGEKRAQVSTKQAVGRANRPKRGTAKAIIWAVADKMWEEAGKPTDKAEVLSLRKLIMNHLETEEAIKRASSSSELGQWHKTRAPF